MTDNLELARKALLAPGGLDEQRLDSMLGLVMGHAVDSADLYFQVSREESWAMEDGIVKEGSASIEEGVGVRAIAGEKTGFAYSDEIHPAALEEASRAARAIARQAPGKGLQAWHRQEPHSLYVAERSAGEPRRRREDRLARARRSRDARDGSAHRAGHGELPGRARDRAGRQFAGRARSRRAPAGALQCLGHRRAERAPRAGLCRRGWPLHDAGALRRRSSDPARARSGAPGAGESRSRAGARGQHDGRARARAGPASCCTRPSATVWKATSTARAPRPSAIAWASAWRARTSPWSTTAR